MTKTKAIRSLGLHLLAGAAILMLCDTAMAADAGKVAANAAKSFNSIGMAVQGFFGLCGLIFIGLSAFTFVKYNKTEGQGAKLSTAFIYLICGGALFYIASLISTTGDTMWGEGQGSRERVTITQ